LVSSIEEAKMIKDREKLNRFYNKLIEEENLSHKEALSIYKQLHREAVSVGAISSQNIWDGIEVSIRIAKALNTLG